MLVRETYLVFQTPLMWYKTVLKIFLLYELLANFINSSEAIINNNNRKQIDS